MICVLNEYETIVDGFASIASPLTRLLKKEATFLWNSEQETAFNRPREILTSPPVLAHFDPKRETELRTDASSVGLSAVLCQKHGSYFKPVYYASRVTNSAERNYAPTVLEAKAIIWAVKKLEPYLANVQFTIISDHSSLQFLSSSKLKGKLGRYALFLQRLNYTIYTVYKPGQQLRDVDPLSRHSTLVEEPLETDEERICLLHSRKAQSARSACS